jgi:thioredoxin 1
MKYRFSVVHIVVLAAALLGTIIYVGSARYGDGSVERPVPGAVKKHQISGQNRKEHTKMGDVAEVTQATFEESVLKSDVPALVDFWAPWCGPCRMVGPVVEELAKEYAGKLKVAKVNTDDQPALAGSYGVRGIPTLIFFKDGQEVDRVVGAQPKSALASKIDSVIGDGKAQE